MITKEGYSNYLIYEKLQWLPKFTEINLTSVATRPQKKRWSLRILFAHIQLCKAATWRKEGGGKNLKHVSYKSKETGTTCQLSVQAQTISERVLYV